ncbi:MAG: hypothetical protein IT270_16385 [Saprospiraceae bacterium]|nr:hypothetical protein [Saprospiraceae bacterium]
MTPKNFDERIKSALDNIEPAYDASTWELLEKRLNAPFTEEHPVSVDGVDKAVFHKLERLEAPYQPAHWDMLATRMQQQDRKRHRILFIKIAEAAIFLLLIANLDGWLSGNKHEVQPTKHTYNGPVASREKGNFVPTDGYGIRNLDANIHQGKSAQNHAAAIDQTPETLDFLTTVLANDNLISIENASTDLPGDVVVPAFVAMASADLLPSGPFAVHYNRVNAAPNASPVKVFRPSNWYVAVGPSIDHNRVSTEFGVRTGTGYGAAVAVGYRKGKWGVESGFDYANKQFEPKQQIEIYSGNVSNGYFGSSLKSVEAGIVSIPFKATRHLVNLGKGSFHALAGASANVVVQKAYNYDTYYFPGSAPSGTRPIDDDETSGIRKPGRGALEQNGQLDGNIYASIDAGIRYEYPIGKRFAAFVEPAYRMALPGQSSLGPKKSSVHTLSVKAGVVTRL